jgi:hypothetical protein
MVSPGPVVAGFPLPLGAVDMTGGSGSRSSGTSCSTGVCV